MYAKGVFFSDIADITNVSDRIEAHSVARCPIEISLMGEFFVARNDVLEGILKELCLH